MTIFLKLQIGEEKHLTKIGRELRYVEVAEVEFRHVIVDAGYSLAIGTWRGTIITDRGVYVAQRKVCC